MARHLITALVLAVAAWMALSSAHAVLPSEMLPDPALEARARALSSELRCMVCQNQSIDDSDAPLAGDLRVLLRERIVAGDSDAEVVDFLVARYGEFILLRPQFNWHTALLWAAPPAVLLLAGIIAVVGFRNRRLSQGREPAPLDGAEREALERLVSGRVKGSNITDP